MQLSAEHFEQITSALRSDVSRGNSREKRGHPRVGLRATVTLIEHGPDGKNLHTVSILRDVSSSGVGIQHCRRIEVGGRFLLQLPAAGGIVHSYLCTVRRCQPVTKDSLEVFHIGATYIRARNTLPTDIGTKTPAAARTAGDRAQTSESARIRNKMLA